MATRERPADRGARRARAMLVELGEELRRGRLERGLSQAVVAEAAGLSRNQVALVEHARAPKATLYDLSRLLSVVGLELSARAFAGANPIRDAAQLQLLRRFRAILPGTVRWTTEVPLPLNGDQRAWDAVADVDGHVIGVEAETRARDLQAVQRRIALKRRDDPRVDRVILLLADTRLNRHVVREFEDLLRADFPVTSALALRRLSGGGAPDGNAIVLC